MIRNGLAVDVDELELALRQGYQLPAIESKRYLDAHTEETLRLFDEFNIKATFFINGASVEPFPGLIKRIADGGHEVAAHGYEHRFVESYKDQSAFREDLKRCVDLITGQTGMAPIGYRAPGNTIYKNRRLALEVLAQEGFIYDSSLPSSANKHQHGYKRGPRRPFQWDNGVYEIPMDFYKVMGLHFPLIGAHALRLAPYWLTSKGLKTRNRHQQPQFIYFHSFELFKQRVSNQCLFYRFPISMIYLARRGRQMTRKVRKLLSQFKFAPYCELLKSEKLKPLQTCSVNDGFAGLELD